MRRRPASSANRSPRNDECTSKEVQSLVVAGPAAWSLARAGVCLGWRSGPLPRRVGGAAAGGSDGGGNGAGPGAEASSMGASGGASSSGCNSPSS
eukprot:4533404-Amphidinium_carterae.2